MLINSAVEEDPQKLEVEAFLAYLNWQCVLKQCKIQLNSAARFFEAEIQTLSLKLLLSL